MEMHRDHHGNGLVVHVAVVVVLEQDFEVEDIGVALVVVVAYLS